MARFPNQFLNQDAIRQQALIHRRFVERIRSLRRFSEVNEEVAKRFVEQQSHFAEQLWRLRRFSEVNEEVAKWFAEQQSHFAEQFRRLADEIPERDRKALQRLGEEGWFLDPEMPAPLLQEMELLFDEHSDEMTEWLSNFFRTRLDVIERALIDSYPHRGHLFQQAFEAHREGKYGLSIPVFLTQADGIFWEQAPERQNLFISRQRKGACREYVSQISNSYIAIYLHPLSTLLPLWMNQNERTERGDSCIGLNRHQVLHGESLDYGTEQNSLKAISLLSYLRWILSKTDE